MKYGMQIVDYLRANSGQITSFSVDGNPSNGYLEIQLANGEIKRFENWDEEDQGVFGCAMNNEPWDPSKRGIPPCLKITTSAASLSITSDKPINCSVNKKTVDDWGTKSSLADGRTLWKNRENSKPEETKPNDSNSGNAFGFKRGFLL